MSTTWSASRPSDTIAVQHENHSIYPISLTAKADDQGFPKFRRGFECHLQLTPTDGASATSSEMTTWWHGLSFEERARLAFLSFNTNDYHGGYFESGLDSVQSQLRSGAVEVEGKVQASDFPEWL